MGLMSGNTETKKSNVFTNLVKVMEIEDISSSNAADVAIKVTVKQEDYEFSNTMYVSGWHSFDQLGSLENWSSSFKVKEFFENCGLTDEQLTDDMGVLLPHIFERATGNQIWTIRYPVKGDSIKPGTRYTWDRCTSVLGGQTKLLNMWKIDVGKGYPRNYDEEYSYNETSQNDGTDFPFGQNDIPKTSNSAGLPPDIPSDL